jgi:hypothetical protein
MNIKFQGFEITMTGDAISWDEVLNELIALSGREIYYKPFNRILCINQDQDDDYILGLYVSIKDQKRFTEIKQTGNAMELSAVDLEEGSRMADFNFFIINKETRRGIYQYYHQSCSLLQFLGYIEYQFFSLRKDRFDETRDDQTLGVDEQQNLLDRINRTKLNAEILVRDENFSALLEEFDSIKEMKFNISTYEPRETRFTALQSISKKRTERILFNKDMLSTVRSGIRTLTSKQGIDEVKVTGAADGVERTISLVNNIEDFGQYDYDELTEHLNVGLDTFTGSEILTLLKRVAQEQAAIFEG